MPAKDLQPSRARLRLRTNSTFDSADQHRPAYGSDVEAFLATQEENREPLAASIGARMVDVDGLTEAEVTARVVDALD